MHALLQVELLPPEKFIPDCYTEYATHSSMNIEYSRIHGKSKFVFGWDLYLLAVNRNKIEGKKPCQT